MLPHPWWVLEAGKLLPCGALRCHCDHVWLHSVGSCCMMVCTFCFLQLLLQSLDLHTLRQDAVSLPCCHR